MEADRSQPTLAYAAEELTRFLEKTTSMAMCGDGGRIEANHWVFRLATICGAAAGGMGNSLLQPAYYNWPDVVRLAGPDHCSRACCTRSTRCSRRRA